MTTPEALRATAVRIWFEGRAATYQSASKRRLWAWQRRREAAAIAAAAGDVHGRAALDFGCGAGFYARLLADARGPPGGRRRRRGGHDRPARRPAHRSRGRRRRRASTWGDNFDLVLLAGVLEFADDAVAGAGQCAAPSRPRRPGSGAAAAGQCRRTALSPLSPPPWAGDRAVQSRPRSHTGRRRGPDGGDGRGQCRPIGVVYAMAAR